jgi:hypothetical protein
MAERDTTSHLQVGVLPRVIAAGMFHRDDKWYGHATLSLMPWAFPATASSSDQAADRRPSKKVAISDWPLEIDRLFNGDSDVRLLVCPVPKSPSEGAALEAPRPALDNCITIKLEPSSKLTPKQKDDVNKLWKTLMADGDEQAWSGLIEALRSSQLGESLGQICQSPTPESNAKRQTDPNGGASQSSQPPDLIALPRADAALLYGFQRAREVLRTMQRQKSQCQINSCIIKTGGRFLDLANFSFENKPWLGLDRDPPKKFAQATISDAPAVGSQLGFAERDALLAKERKEQEARYQEKMGPEHREKAKQQSESRLRYLERTKLSERIQALEDHAKVRATSRAPADCAEACSSADDTEVNKATDDIKAVHALGAMPDLDEFGNPVLSPQALQDAFDIANERVQHRLFAITSMPSLARLFNLVIDVEFDADKLENAEWAPNKSPGQFADDGAIDHWGELSENQKDIEQKSLSAWYLFLATDFGWDKKEGPDPITYKPNLFQPSDQVCVWTYAKYRPAEDKNRADQPGHFWPCAREEIDLKIHAEASNKTANIRESCAVFQYDGVVDLGIVYCPDGLARNPRYDLVSLDTIQTVESDMQLERRFKRLAGADTGDQMPSSTLGVQTRRTGGLALIDRWRQDQAVSQITTAKYLIESPKPDKHVVLDAEDLTTAYRLDVGVDTEPETPDDSGMVWRCLMNRNLEFGSKENGTDWIEDVIQSLYAWGEPKASKGAIERRRRADGASLSIASRIRQNAAQRGTSGASTGFAEQIIITWHGDPLGVDCPDPGDAAEGGVREEVKGLSMDANGLSLDISFGLEDKHTDYRPPSLRYGWPYHVGLRPVYLGGVILPIESAVARYEKNFVNGSAFPNRSEHQGRRFLRHERIEAPALTVPEVMAKGLPKEIADEIRDKDPAVISNGASCILRTWEVGQPKAKEPNATVRILFPPIMQLNQAMLHGVFDQDNVEEIKVDGRHLVRPKDGLKSLDFSGGRGAENRRSGGFPHFINAAAPDKNARGPAVFRIGGDSASRKIPFYPDPSAAFYVVAARRTNTDDDYLAGDPILVPVHGAGAAYPDVFPLALEIRKRARRSSPARLVEDLFPTGKPALARANQEGAIGPLAGAGIAVQHLVVELAPGEDFEIDVWCIPTCDELVDKFDIVESVTLLMMRDSTVENFADGSPNLACLDSLARHFPKSVAEELEELSRLEQANPLCGPGGMVLPHDKIIVKVADTILAALKKMPMPELAAVTSLHAIHAIDRPLADPQFIIDASAYQMPKIVRLNDDTFDELMSNVDPPEGSSAWNLLCQSDWSELSEDGATNAIVNSKINVDLLTTFDVELRARMVSPASAVFDNVNRGRTIEEKARGAYRPFGWVPKRIAGVVALPLQAPNAQQWPRLTAEAIAKDAVKLFGFNVDVRGHVEFPRYWASLLRLQHLDDVALPRRTANMRAIDLLDAQREAARLNPHPKKLLDPQPDQPEDTQPKGQGIQAKFLQTFRDGLARKFELQLVATSRFSNLYPDENAAERVRTSKTVFAWLPATKRPDPLSALSLRPSFTWVHGKPTHVSSGLDPADARSVTTTARHCTIHLSFERPHFTSGEGERVGVVTWPPDLMLGAKAEEIESDLVRRSGQADQSPIQLDKEFSDSDLGPGGEYITRWGADPIRRGQRPKGWLIPAKAFLDAGNPDVEFEPNVLMPIPRKPDASSGGGGGDVNSGNNNRAGASDTLGREFMLVSLLTYEARFDVDYERWYIDVRIDADQVPEPFIRLGLVRFQKHARRELQVSEPIPLWVPVMQKRSVRVSVAPPDKGSRRTELAIDVSTPARYEGFAPVLEAGSEHASSPGDAPFMRAYLLREESLGEYGSVQAIVPPEDDFNALATQLLPSRTSAGTVWSGSIGFLCSELHEQSKSSYSVYVEEVEAYPSTANPVDDLSGAPTASVVESGQRFAAIVPIEIPPAVAKKFSPPMPAPKKTPPLHHASKKSPPLKDQSP